MSTEMVPFGKHKGKPVDALLDDRPYLDWLLAQPWFKEKFGNVYNIVINNGAEPTETPEHNAMQIRFLDEAFRLKFAVAVLGEKIFESANSEAYAKFLSKVNSAKKKAEKQIRAAGTSKENEENLAELDGLEILGPAWADAPKFEDKGVDVEFRVYCGWGTSPAILAVAFEQLDHQSIRYEYIEVPQSSSGLYFSIELKPSVGDDYPAILRQMKRNQAKYLLLRTYTGIGATEAQFREFFKSQGITVVFEHEVDAVVLPAFDREISQEGK